ncbi:PEP-CTERM sorting domain-containing protein [Thalassotalea sp. LPB0316]|uniref:PEP-CTERM sorting domain-containing protein n=1 Tax=Thalassotalea sp. LPB0316 TaxID=2769490 RepID=UPI0018678828|nr:PEP-CTERM sorting domain-containing protein [Thalassotalea sp. LPB0316]QOL25812.1 PEP-CTERM sorting domain-containing protein [Thalassotalea sp. LPB0316]
MIKKASKYLATCSLMTLLSFNANAGLMAIGDVDAMNTGFRQDNFNLLDAARFGGDNIAWLDGGTNYVFDSRHTNLQNQWSNNGISITYDQTNDISTSLIDRDLVIVSLRYFTDAGFSQLGRDKLADYLSAGGNMLYVSQPGGNYISHNDFLADIGSAIRYTGSFVGSGTFNVQAGSSYDPAGNYLFELGGVNELTGGTVLVSDGLGKAGVVCENCNNIQVPEPSTLSLFAIFISLLSYRKFKMQ